MYLAKCPLRISLVGGSTDLQAFIDKYKRGAVISFPSNLHVYISIHDNNRNKYILNYSKKEEVEEIEEIKNDVARVALRYFGVGPVTISFESDIISTGSGLASSSAFMIALVKALSMYTKQHLTEYEVCSKALQLERGFNPETGYQDSYGCGIGGFKRIDFRQDRNPSFCFQNAEFLTENFDMALYHTKTNRSSTTILKTVEVQKCKPLLTKVDQLEKSITQNDVDEFLSVFNRGWALKKKTSSSIAGSETFHAWDKAFKDNPNVLGFKLCGAGGGGYFFALCVKGFIPESINGSPAIPIEVNETGLVGQVF